MTSAPNDTWFARHERLFVILLIAALAVVSFLPHLIAFINTPVGFKYIWLNYPGSPHDINSYFTWIKQASDGNWLFNLKYTAEPTARVVFHPLFLAMGFLVRIGVPLTAVWIVVQIASIAALVASLRFLLMQYLQNPLRRFFAATVALVSGGLGFLTNTFQWYRSFDTLPVDMSMPEATLARSIMTPFIFDFSIALVLSAFALLISYERSRRRRDLILASLCAFALGIIHPYDIVIVAAVAAPFLLIRLKKDALRPLVVLGTASGIPFLYYLLVMTNRSYAAAGNAEMFSPAPLAYLLGFGLLLPFAVAGAIVLIRNGTLRWDPAWQLAMLFLCAIPVLVYIPFTFQRKLIEGWVVPVSIFAAVGMGALWTRFRSFGPFRYSPLRAIVIIGSLAILSLTPLTLLRNDFWTFRDGGFPYYMSDEELAGMRWLSGNTDRSAVILSAPDYGSIVPRFSGNTVFIGHWAQTVDFDRKATLVNEFYTSTMDRQQHDLFLADNRIAYVIYGPVERNNWPDARLGSDPSLTIAFSDSRITIYRVETSGI